jgi:hypothetical protein
MPFTTAIFAGYAAEHALLGEQLIVESEDWDRYYSRITPLFRKEHRFDAFSQKMLRAAVRFARLRSSEIHTIANALYTRRRLTEKQAQKIYEQAKGNGDGVCDFEHYPYSVHGIHCHAQGYCPARPTNQEGAYVHSASNHG